MQPNTHCTGLESKSHQQWQLWYIAQPQAFFVVLFPLVVLLPLVTPPFLTPVLLLAAALEPCFPPAFALSAFPSFVLAEPVLLWIALVLVGEDLVANLESLLVAFAVDLVSFLSSSSALGFLAAADLVLRVCAAFWPAALRAEAGLDAARHERRLFVRRHPAL